MTIIGPYKGYMGQLDIDTDAGVLYGEVIDVNDVIAFEGMSVKEALQSFHDSVDDYLAFCKELGRRAEKPFSGKIPFRTSAEHHREIYIAAQILGKSMNAWMDDVLTIAAERIMEAHKGGPSEYQKVAVPVTFEGPVEESVDPLGTSREKAAVEEAIRYLKEKYLVGQGLEAKGVEEVKPSTQPLSPDRSSKENEVKLAEDRELVQRASQGDLEALSKLYENSIEFIYRYMYTSVRNLSEAESLTDETFTRAIEALSQGHYTRQDEPFKAWLFTIASDVLLQRNRKQRELSHAPKLDISAEHRELLSEEVNSLKSLVQEQEQYPTWQLVNELPPAERSVMILRYVSQLSFADIAICLGRSEASSKQLHYRALKKLKQKMQEGDIWSSIRSDQGTHGRP